WREPQAARWRSFATAMVAGMLLGPMTFGLGTRGRNAYTPGMTKPDAQGMTHTKTAPQNGPPLKNSFKGKFLIGAALYYPALQGRAPLDLAIATRHFNAFTPANSMKPDALQRTEGQFTFTDGDRLVEIAEKSGATPIGHVLVWHEQTPKWFFEG